MIAFALPHGIPNGVGHEFGFGFVIPDQKFRTSSAGA
jgi:hypothetical protein